MKCQDCIQIKLVWLGVVSLICKSLGETHHKTKGATEKQHDLWCYKCNTMVDGERCLEMDGNNYTSMHHKCSREQKKCQVQRISMSTSTDEVTGKPTLWLLQRNCIESCEPGCIVIGERTKLHSCITCCDEHNYCNAGNSAPAFAACRISSFLIIITFILQLAIGNGIQETKRPKLCRR
uniref:Uncharacterized protein LOC114340115 isoform X3 n=1 Tax=Diabrotica virgifera virgifera TaxID=50390 RepID=A0A6P7GN84_DIAVI